MSADSGQPPEPVAESDGYLVPEDLRKHDIWVLWDVESKIPLSPWETGDMYPANWGQGTVADPDSRMKNRPETRYEKAAKVAEFPPSELHEYYNFPTEDGEPELPDDVRPTIILPHTPPDPPIMLIDFDEVRDPSTGRVSREVASIVRDLDAYCEVSRSGDGLHVYVRAELPGRLGKFIADLDTRGHIEMYDHGRFVGCTWDHVGGTPTTVPERQGVVDGLIERYESEDQRDRRENADLEDIPEDAAAALAKLRKSEAGRRNDYYQLDIRAVADRGEFSMYRDATANNRNEWQGPHPDHGALKSNVRECTNFIVDPSKNVWHCFAHDTGGGPLSLIAVLEDVVGCGASKDVHRDPEKLLKTCLAARDDYSSSLSESVPPYKVLVEVAERFDLSMKEPDEAILGKDAHRLSMVIYSELSAGDV